MGRSDGDAITVNGGLKAILAISRDGVDLTPGVLTDENKLDGEGPFRVVVPQKSVNRRISAAPLTIRMLSGHIWRTGTTTQAPAPVRTIIRVEPLPEGTTDVDILEAGWTYVDEEKILIYGAISAADDPTGDSGNTDVTSDKRMMMMMAPVLSSPSLNKT